MRRLRRLMGRRDDTRMWLQKRSAMRRIAVWLGGSLCLAALACTSAAQDPEVVPVFTVDERELSQPADVFVHEQRSEVCVL